MRNGQTEANRLLLTNLLQVDADQWISTAREAGMKYVILVTKHVDGFCLWNSQYTDYDVASSGNKTNVVEAVAKACKKYGVGLGIYYSLWDRHQNANLADTTLDKAYNIYIVNQIRGNHRNHESIHTGRGTLARCGLGKKEGALADQRNL